MLTNFNALALGLGPSIKVKERSFNNNEDISIIYCISREYIYYLLYIQANTIPLPFRIYSHETFIPPPIYDTRLKSRYHSISAQALRAARGLRPHLFFGNLFGNFEVECDTTKKENELTDRTDTMIVPFIVLDNTFSVVIQKGNARMLVGRQIFPVNEENIQDINVL